MPGPFVAALPWAIPAAISAAGAIGGAISGSNRRKREEKKEAERASWAQGTYGDVGERFKGYGERAAGIWQPAQDWGMGELRGIYDQIGEGGGGGTPGYKGEFDASKNWWQQVADTGWRSPEQKDAGWGWGNFKNFAETGGWSPEEMADFRARSSSGIPGFYGGMRDELNRGRTVQGGYGPGYTEAGSQMARDRSRAMGEAQLGAETSLASSIREGKRWGSEQGVGAARGELEQMTGGQGQLDTIAQKIADMNRQAAASRNASRDRDMAMRLGLIDRYTGLARETGGELSYASPELAAYGGYAGTRWPNTPAQQQGPSFWDRMSSSGANVAGSILTKKYGG